MSDNPTPKCFTCSAPMNEGEAKCFTVCDDCWEKEKPQPPAPRLSEEEIQLLTGKLYIGLVNEPIYTWHEKCATILRTLNESRKA